MDIEKIKKDNMNYIDEYELYQTEDITGDKDLFSIYKYLFKKKINEATKEFNKLCNDSKKSDILVYIADKINYLKITYKEDKKKDIVTYYNRDNVFIGKYEQNRNVISDSYIDACQRAVFQTTGDTFVLSNECRCFIKCKLIKRLKELEMD